MAADVSNNTMLKHVFVTRAGSSLVTVLVDPSSATLNICLCRFHGILPSLVDQLCPEIVGFILHHLADAIPTEPSTLWFLVISSCVQLACSVAM